MAPRILIVLLLGFASLRTLAQAGPGQDFSSFINANEKFGRTLLQETHLSAPEQNVAVSPLPVTFTFALLREGSDDGATLDEIQTAFEWSGMRNLTGPSLMLLALFHPLPPRPAPVHPRTRLEATMEDLMGHESREYLWISTTFTHRGKGVMSKRFEDRGKHDYGVEFRTAPPEESQQSVLSHSQNPSVPLPTASTVKNDFWIVSSTHLQTVWADNTFSMGTKKNDDFILNTGHAEQVPMLVSELNSYRHAKTKDFEAIELVCQMAYLQIVLPEKTADVRELEAKLARDDGLLFSSMKSEIGDVEIPKFSFRFNADIRQALEKMGVRKVFHSMDSLREMAPGEGGAMLQGIAQNVEIEVNEQGIRANAGTVASGIYGGIMGGQPVPFHMVVNRPFVFFIRDNVTDALLFAGVVMDPAKH